MILRKLSLLTLLSVCLSSLSQTSIRLPDIISSGMVLQQQTEVKIWGKATPGSRISIHTDWTRKRHFHRSRCGQHLVPARYHSQSIMAPACNRFARERERHHTGCSFQCPDWRGMVLLGTVKHGNVS